MTPAGFDAVATDEPGFVARYLDPASRLGEVLFGLIMVLTITLSEGLTVSEGPEGVRQLLAAALGCNIAWGFIDAVMYLMNCVTERAEKAYVVRAIREAPDAVAALDVVRREVEPRVGALAGKPQRDTVCRAILEYLSHAEPPAPGLTRDDLYGATACFWLVFLACLPAAAPFLVFSDPHRALRVSNALLLAMLFVVGQKWAQYAHMNRFAAGAVMIAIGLALVGVAILLGG